MIGECLSTGEVAAILQVSVKEVQRMCDAGEIPTLDRETSRRRFIPASALGVVLAERQRRDRERHEEARRRFLAAVEWPGR